MSDGKPPPPAPPPPSERGGLASSSPLPLGGGGGWGEGAASFSPPPGGGGGGWGKGALPVPPVPGGRRDRAAARRRLPTLRLRFPQLRLLVVATAAAHADAQREPHHHLRSQGARPPRSRLPGPPARGALDQRQRHVPRSDLLS